MTSPELNVSLTGICIAENSLSKRARYAYVCCRATHRSSPSFYPNRLGVVDHVSTFVVFFWHPHDGVEGSVSVQRAMFIVQQKFVWFQSTNPVRASSFVCSLACFGGPIPGQTLSANTPQGPAQQFSGRSSRRPRRRNLRPRRPLLFCTGNTARLTSLLGFGQYAECKILCSRSRHQVAVDVKYQYSVPSASRDHPQACSQATNARSQRIVG